MMVDEVAAHLNKETRQDPVSMIVNVEIKPDRLDEFKKAIAIDAAGSRLEPGCFRFDVLADPENPCKFTFYECYTDMDAVAFHAASPHFKVWNDFRESGGVVSVSKQ